MSLTEKIKDKLDRNKDGKVDKKDFDFNKDGETNWKDIGWFLIGLAAILFNLFLDYIQSSIEINDWKPNGELDIIGYIMSAIIILWFTKKKFQLMDKELLGKDEKIDELNKEKLVIELEKRDDKAEYSLKEQELQAANNTKREFIDLIWAFVDEEVKKKITRID